MLRPLLVIVALGGCHEVFGTGGPDASIAIDDVMPDSPASCWAPTLALDDDEDGTPDGCDLCPANLEGNDEDQDLVGDACDPEPANPRQRWVYFDGFQAPRPDPDPWTTTGAGTWEIGLSVVKQTKTSVDSRYELALPVVQRPAVDVVFDIVGDPQDAAGAFIDLNGEVVSCYYELRSGGMHAFVLDSPGLQVETTFPGPNPIRIQMFQDAEGKVNCIGRHAGMRAPPLIVPAGQTVTIRAGLLSSQCDPTFRSFGVLSSQP